VAAGSRRALRTAGKSRSQFHPHHGPPHALPPLERPAGPITGNPKTGSEIQQQQRNSTTSRNQDRQRCSNSRRENTNAAKQSANQARRNRWNSATSSRHSKCSNATYNNTADAARPQPCTSRSPGPAVASSSGRARTIGGLYGNVSARQEMTFFGVNCGCSRHSSPHTARAPWPSSPMRLIHTPDKRRRHLRAPAAFLQISRPAS